MSERTQTIRYEWQGIASLPVVESLKALRIPMTIIAREYFGVSRQAIYAAYKQHSDLNGLTRKESAQNEESKGIANSSSTRS